MRHGQLDHILLINLQLKNY